MDISRSLSIMALCVVLSCLYTPNIGSYQGHGNLTYYGFIDNSGTVKNVTLFEYDTNGR